MQPTSTTYQYEMAKELRGQGYAKITFGLVDIDAAEDSKITNDDGLYFSDTSKLVYSNGIPKKTYATFETDRMKLDGTQLIASKENPIMQGYVSSIVSGADCVFSPQPTVVIQFTKTHRMGAFSLVFDAAGGTYPSEVKVTAYRQGIIIKEHLQTGIDGFSFVIQQEFRDFDKLVINFVKSSKPFHRARLQQVVFGVGIVFDNNTISKFTRVEDIDPITRRLPTNSFEFTIINLDGMYNPDNPRGVWESIENQMPISFEYGQRIMRGLTWGDVYNETWGELELTNWRTVYETNY